MNHGTDVTTNVNGVQSYRWTNEALYSVLASSDPFWNSKGVTHRDLILYTSTSIERFWDLPGSNGVAASEACPNCHTRNADDFEIIDGYNCGAYVRCSCGHEYTIEDQFSN